MIRICTTCAAAYDSLNDIFVDRRCGRCREPGAKRAATAAPETWPRCPSCGRYCADDSAEPTCGKAECKRVVR